MDNPAQLANVFFHLTDPVSPVWAESDERLELALTTLCTFEFCGRVLTKYTLHCVLPHTSHKSTAIAELACLCSVKLIAPASGTFLLDAIVVVKVLRELLGVIVTHMAEPLAVTILQHLTDRLEVLSPFLVHVSF